MAAIDMRIHGGTVADPTKFVAGVPALVLTAPNVAHDGRQIQYSEDGTNVAPLFVCAEETRPLFLESFIWAEVAASMAWFVGFTVEGAVLDASSVLTGDDLVGFYSAPGEATVQLVSRRSGVASAVVLGTFSDGGVMQLGLRVWGERSGVSAFAKGVETKLVGSVMPEATVPLVLTVAMTQTVSAERKLAVWGMLAGQDRLVLAE